MGSEKHLFPAGAGLFATATVQPESRNPRRTGSLFRHPIEPTKPARVTETLKARIYLEQLLFGLKTECLKKRASRGAMTGAKNWKYLAF